MYYIFQVLVRLIEMNIRTPPRSFQQLGHLCPWQHLTAAEGKKHGGNNGLKRLFWYITIWVISLDYDKSELTKVIAEVCEHGDNATAKKSATGKETQDDHSGCK